MTIKCEICGAGVHSIAKHLKDTHGAESAQPMSLADYRTKYPEAPLMSEAAKKKLEEKRKQAEQEAAEAAAAAPSTAPAAATKTEDFSKVAFHEAFRFDPKVVKGALTKSGSPIYCTRDNRSDEYDYYIPKWNENYFLNPDLTKILMMGLETRKPIFLFGHSGVGKSSVFKQVCAGLNRRMFRFQHTIDTEESHIVGQWVVKKHIDDNGNAISITEFEPGPLVLAMQNGWLYLADEMDRSPPSVLSAYQAVLEGEPLIVKNAPEHLRVIKPHPMFAFAATGNTNGTGDQTGLYQATLTQDAATIERFGIVAEVDYPPEKQEIAMIAAATGMTPADAGKIRQFAHEIRTKAFPNQVSLTIGPRVAINIAQVSMMKGSTIDGVMYAYSNRLPEAEREAALGLAKRIFA